MSGLIACGGVASLLITEGEPSAELDGSSLPPLVLEEKNLSLSVLQNIHSDNLIMIPCDSTNIAMLPGNGAKKGLDNPQV